MEFREFSAKTVDEAITKASLEFETFSENLEIEVISEGKAGFLGFGSKPAIIKARKKETIQSVEEPTVKEEPKAVKKEVRKEVKKEIKKEPKKEVKKEVKVEPEQPKEERKVVERSPEEIAEMKAEAEKFLSGVFKAMELEVEIKMDYKAAEGNLDIEFVGQDMGILIREERTDSGFTAVPYKPSSKQGQTGLCSCKTGYRGLQKQKKRNTGKSGKKHCI